MSIEAVAIAGVSEAFKFSIGELFNAIKAKSSKFHNSNVNLVNAYRNAILVENVKTIWQVDRAVNLNNFYYPSKLIVDNQVVEISSLSDLPKEVKCVIQGNAGQGKSIFLRYLTGSELRKGDQVPLFVELRKISEKKSLEKLIVDALSELGIKSDSQTLDLILGTGRISLLLDAFDEIPDEQVKDTVTFIESVVCKHHQLRVVISSRPDSAIQNSTLFSVYKLSPIGPSDFRPILDKFFNGKSEVVEEIVSSIHKSGSNIKGLITTPLLLTLLTITYKGYNKIPESSHQFYEGLFPLLVHRHDSTKPGFIRSYASKLNENQLEKLFCAFSFFCMLGQKVSLTRLEAIEQAKKASDNVKINPSSESTFISDCVKNTCLIVQEGSEFHFIHKSIREYHSARFIRESDIELKVRFYESAVLNQRKYREELKYLKEIDSSCFEEFFLIPTFKRVLEYFEWDGSVASLEVNFLRDYSVHISLDDSGKYCYSGSSINGETPIANDFKLFYLFVDRAGACVESSLVNGALIFPDDFDSMIKEESIAPIDIADNKVLLVELSSCANEICKDLDAQLKELCNLVDERKKSIELIGF